MARKLIIGNWKMNLRSEQAKVLVEHLIQDVDVNQPWVSIAVPAVYLQVLFRLLQSSNICLAAQDVSQYAQDGAHTGEISAAMLADCGCRYVLVGHSERRQYFGETNAQLLQKMQNVMGAGMVSVLCVGETLAQREEGRYLEAIRAQVAPLAQLGQAEYIIAYEPLWAIGTGKIATVEQIIEVHREIKNGCLQSAVGSANIRVLYGGSVKADNARAILEADDVDGVLVGGASLDAEIFGTICKVAGKII